MTSGTYNQEGVLITKTEQEEGCLSKQSSGAVGDFSPVGLEKLKGGSNQPLENVEHSSGIECSEAHSDEAETVISVIKGNIGMSEGGSILESTSATNAASEETSRGPEHHHDASEHQNISKDEKIVEIVAENVHHDALETTTHKAKTESQSLKVVGGEVSESMRERTMGEGKEALLHGSDLAVENLNGEAEMVSDACNKDTNVKSDSSNDAPLVQKELVETSLRAEEQVSEKSKDSVGEETDIEANIPREKTEDEKQEKENATCDITEDESISTIAASSSIQNKNHTISEIGENGRDKLDGPSVSLETGRVSVHEAGLEGQAIGEVANFLCDKESQDTGVTSEHVKDLAQVHRQMQPNNDLETFTDTEIEEMCLQIEENLSTVKEIEEMCLQHQVSETQPGDIKHSPEEEQNEAFQGTAQNDSIARGKGTDDEHPEAKFASSVLKCEEAEQSKERDQSSRENVDNFTLNEEEKTIEKGMEENYGEDKSTCTDDIAEKETSIEKIFPDKENETADVEMSNRNFGDIHVPHSLVDETTGVEGEDHEKGSKLETEERAPELSGTSMEEDKHIGNELEAKQSTENIELEQISTEQAISLELSTRKSESNETLDNKGNSHDKDAEEITEDTKEEAKVDSSFLLREEDMQGKDEDQPMEEVSEITNVANIDKFKTIEALEHDSMENSKHDFVQQNELVVEKPQIHLDVVAEENETSPREDVSGSALAIEEGLVKTLDKNLEGKDEEEKPSDTNKAEKIDVEEKSQTADDECSKGNFYDTDVPHSSVDETIQAESENLDGVSKFEQGEQDHERNESKEDDKHIGDKLEAHRSTESTDLEGTSIQEEIMMELNTKEGESIETLGYKGNLDVKDAEKNIEKTKVEAKLDSFSTLCEESMHGQGKDLAMEDVSEIITEKNIDSSKTIEVAKHDNMDVFVQQNEPVNEELIKSLDIASDQGDKTTASNENVDSFSFIEEKQPIRTIEESMEATDKEDKPIDTFNQVSEIQPWDIKHIPEEQQNEAFQGPTQNDSIARGKSTDDEHPEAKFVSSVLKCEEAKQGEEMDQSSHEDVDNFTLNEEEKTIEKNMEENYREEKPAHTDDIAEKETSIEKIVPPDEDSETAEVELSNRNVDDIHVPRSLVDEITQVERENPEKASKLETEERVPELSGTSMEEDKHIGNELEVKQSTENTELEQISAEGATTRKGENNETLDYKGNSHDKDGEEITEETKEEAKVESSFLPCVEDMQGKDEDLPVEEVSEITNGKNIDNFKTIEVSEHDNMENSKRDFVQQNELVVEKPQISLDVVAEENETSLREDVGGSTLAIEEGLIKTSDKSLEGKDEEEKPTDIIIMEKIDAEEKSQTAEVECSKGNFGDIDVPHSSVDETIQAESENLDSISTFEQGEQAREQNESKKEDKHIGDKLEANQNTENIELEQTSREEEIIMELNTSKGQSMETLDYKENSDVEDAEKNIEETKEKVKLDTLCEEGMHGQGKDLAMEDISEIITEKNIDSSKIIEVAKHDNMEVFVEQNEPVKEELKKSLDIASDQGNKTTASNENVGSFTFVEEKRSIRTIEKSMEAADEEDKPTDTNDITEKESSAEKIDTHEDNQPAEVEFSNKIVGDTHIPRPCVDETTQVEGENPQNISKLKQEEQAHELNQASMEEDKHIGNELEENQTAEDTKLEQILAEETAAMQLNTQTFEDTETLNSEGSLDVKDAEKSIEEIKKKEDCSIERTKINTKGGENEGVAKEYAPALALRAECTIDEKAEPSLPAEIEERERKSICEGKSSEREEDVENIKNSTVHPKITDRGEVTKEQTIEGDVTCSSPEPVEEGRMESRDNEKEEEEGTNEQIITEATETVKFAGVKENTEEVHAAKEQIITDGNDGVSSRDVILEDSVYLQDDEDTEKSKKEELENEAGGSISCFTSQDDQSLDTSLVKQEESSQVHDLNKSPIVAITEGKSYEEKTPAEDGDNNVLMEVKQTTNAENDTEKEDSKEHVINQGNYEDLSLDSVGEPLVDVPHNEKEMEKSKKETFQGSENVAVDASITDKTSHDNQDPQWISDTTFVEAEESLQEDNMFKKPMEDKRDDERHFVATEENASSTTVEKITNTEEEVIQNAEKVSEETTKWEETKILDDVTENETDIKTVPEALKDSKSTERNFLELDSPNMLETTSASEETREHNERDDVKDMSPKSTEIETTPDDSKEDKACKGLDMEISNMIPEKESISIEAIAELSPLVAEEAIKDKSKDDKNNMMDFNEEANTGDQVIIEQTKNTSPVEAKETETFEDMRETNKDIDTFNTAEALEEAHQVAGNKSILESFNSELPETEIKEGTLEEEKSTSENPSDVMLADTLQDSCMMPLETHDPMTVEERDETQERDEPACETAKPLYSVQTTGEKSMQKEDELTSRSVVHEVRPSDVVEKNGNEDVQMHLDVEQHISPEPQTNLQSTKPDEKLDYTSKLVAEDESTVMLPEKDHGQSDENNNIAQDHNWKFVEEQIIRQQFTEGERERETEENIEPKSKDQDHIDNTENQKENAHAIAFTDEVHNGIQKDDESENFKEKITEEENMKEGHIASHDVATVDKVEVFGTISTQYLTREDSEQKEPESSEKEIITMEDPEAKEINTDQGVSNASSKHEVQGVKESLESGPEEKLNAYADKPETAVCRGILESRLEETQLDDKPVEAFNNIQDEKVLETTEPSLHGNEVDSVKLEESSQDWVSQLSAFDHNEAEKESIIVRNSKANEVKRSQEDSNTLLESEDHILKETAAHETDTTETFVNASDDKDLETSETSLHGDEVDNVKDGTSTDLVSQVTNFDTEKEEKKSVSMEDPETSEESCVKETHDKLTEEKLDAAEAVATVKTEAPETRFGESHLDDKLIEDFHVISDERVAVTAEASLHGDEIDSMKLGETSSHVVSQLSTCDHDKTEEEESIIVEDPEHTRSRAFSDASLISEDHDVTQAGEIGADKNQTTEKLDADKGDKTARTGEAETNMVEAKPDDKPADDLIITSDKRSLETIEVTEAHAHGDKVDSMDPEETSYDSVSQPQVIDHENVKQGSLSVENTNEDKVEESITAEIPGATEVQETHIFSDVVFVSKDEAKTVEPSIMRAQLDDKPVTPFTSNPDEKSLQAIEMGETTLQNEETGNTELEESTSDGEFILPDINHGNRDKGSVAVDEDKVEESKLSSDAVSESNNQGGQVDETGKGQAAEKLCADQTFETVTDTEASLEDAQLDDKVQKPLTTTNDESSMGITGTAEASLQGEGGHKIKFEETTSNLVSQLPISGSKNAEKEKKAEGTCDAYIVEETIIAYDAVNELKDRDGEETGKSLIMEKLNPDETFATVTDISEETSLEEAKESLLDDKYVNAITSTPDEKSPERTEALQDEVETMQLQDNSSNLSTNTEEDNLSKGNLDERLKETKEGSDAALESEVDRKRIERTGKSLVDDKIENETVAGQILTAEKREEQLQISNIALPVDEQTHRGTTTINKLEEQESMKKVKTLEDHSNTMVSEEPCLQKEEDGKLKAATRGIELSKDLQRDSPSVVCEGEARSLDGAFRLEKQEEEAEFKYVSSPSESEQATELTRPSKEDPVSKSETSEGSSKSEAEIHSHEAFTKSEDAEIVEMISDVTKTDLRTEEYHRAFEGSQTTNIEVPSEKVSEKEVVKGQQEKLNAVEVPGDNVDKVPQAIIHDDGTQNEEFIEESKNPHTHENRGKGIETEDNTFEDSGMISMKDETDTERFPDEPGRKDRVGATIKSNLENANCQIISGNSTGSASLIYQESGTEIPQGTLVNREANEITPNIGQKEQSSPSRAQRQIPEETFNETTERMILTMKEDVPPKQNELDGESQELGNVTDVDSQVSGIEHGGQEQMINVSGETTDPNKFSLSDLLHRSKKETLQVAGHSTEQEESRASKEEMTTQVTETIPVEEPKSNEGDGDEHEKTDPGSDAPVIVEAARDIDVKAGHKKSHGILSGVGSKVKHSYSKVKKVITGKSSHPKSVSPK